MGLRAGRHALCFFDFGPYYSSATTALLIGVAKKLLMLCNSLHVPWAVLGEIDHPCWSHPEMRQQLFSDISNSTVLDRCSYGVKWQMRSILALGNCCGGDIEGFRTPLCEQHNCRCTGRPHQRLAGRTPQGVLWKNVAKRLPPELCRCVSRVLVDATVFNRPPTPPGELTIREVEPRMLR